MERELVELFEAAKKAADAAASDGVSSNGPEVVRCVDALKQLKIFPISYDILVSSQVGKRLRPLTKHPREKIQTVASDLLEMWKKIVIDETTRKKNGTVDNKSSVKAEVSKVETIKVEKVQKASTVKVEKIDRERTVKVEKKSEEKQQAIDVKKPSQASVTPPKLTAIVKCNDALRDKIRELLVEALSKVVSEANEDGRDEISKCDPIRVAVSVESAMFEKMGRSNGAQKFKYRSIMFNLKDPNNPDLRRKVLLGEVKPERLISMTPEEMASKERQEEINQIKEKALFDCERGGPAKATTDQFKCSRCGQRKCTYYQMQTRSADEPMTTYVTCVNCNKHWKFC
ncbi:transcription elongation factor TFIIS [Ricinus communis]|uniref:Transcription elongation factor n=1 Tax=Ricinus communis TaxID=3988 RepID=B9SRT6_RICCO|nr:transcription elongation factor TFIIS [Ricinus communis]EEF33688.1 transcription elongation factor s-II, putative [Ricinus communis]|eukprot:XP_002528699.1 transcription elongation factor TFIIS [Ricinus communis]